MIRKAFLISIIFLYISANVFARVEITINGGTRDPIGISFKKITGESIDTLNLSYELKERIQLQLEDTQLFKIHSENETTKKRFSFFRRFMRNYLKKSNVFGELSVVLIPLEDKNILAKVYLKDLFVKSASFNKEIIFSKGDWHIAASQISDLIYQHYTGIEGYFDTKLVFLSEYGSLVDRTKKITMMDLYGDNMKHLTNGKEIVLSPRMSPDGKQIVYFSYIDSIPTLYLLDLETMRHRRLLDFDGMVYSPRFSYDGTKIVLTASYSGNSEIIIYDVKTKDISRITNNYAIDTTPSISPDNSKIVFSSDRTGSQKLYMMDINGKNLQQLNFLNGN